jgi:hypothetical protein
MPKLSILKDGSVEHSTAAFDYFCPRILQTARLIENGGFEGGLTRWGGYEGSLQLSTDCHRGLCVEFAGLEGSRSYIAEWQVAKLEMGHTYQFSAWLRSKSPAPQNVALGVWDQDVSQWVSRTEVALPAVWTRFQQRFTNTSPNRLAIQFVKTSRAAGTFMVDDVSVEETHEPN